MLLPNRHEGTPDYRYGFQGQEMDDEVKGEGNSLNYKYRMQDPRVGRFFAVDPLTHSYPWNSSYAFSENMVIQFVELEGLEISNPMAAMERDLRENGTLFQKTAVGTMLMVDDTCKGIMFIWNNPSDAAKGVGNFLVGLIATNAATSKEQLESNHFAERADAMFGTSSKQAMDAFDQSISKAGDMLINGDAVDRSRIISGVFTGIAGDKGLSKIVKLGRVSILAKIPGGKIIQYIAGEHKYLYHADDSGRILRAQTDNLQLKTHEGRLTHDPNTPGKMPGDHAGHLLADLFGGDPSLKNLVSQASNVNLSAFKTIENIWKNAVAAGKKVEVDIKVNYKGESVRPDNFDVTYKIDGKVYNQVIENTNPPKG
ncbi:DNA/RNA non-specific endonuclease [Algibacter sp. 2305UL17-15]|uniref:DNA/RNA non-specific endonuclease n=1 Tax=Algibacter sp. 2305UL17-15 TaxID=3231268 RepID=UPI00345A5F99